MFQSIAFVFTEEKIKLNLVIYRKYGTRTQVLSSTFAYGTGKNESEIRSINTTDLLVHL